MKKIYRLGLLVLIFLTILSIILIKPLNDLDEIWNYNFARNVCDNLIPYKDFSMLPMPLLPLFCGLFLKLIANELMVMRVLTAILATLIIFMIYKVCKKLDINDEFSILITFIIGLLLINYFCIDYNWASLLLVLLLIYSEIKEYKKDNVILKANIKTDIVIGIIAGLTFTLKQTSGLLICSVAITNKLFFLRSKKDFCTYLKTFLFRLIGVLIPVITMIIYLLYSVAMQDFISYTVKGVAGFSNYISYFNLLNLDIVGVLAILVPACFIYSVYKVLKTKDTNLYYLLVYGLAIFIIAFPISDKIHFLIGATPLIITIFYYLSKKLNNIEKRPIMLKVSHTFIAICMVIVTTINFYVYINSSDSYSNLPHYKNIIIDKEFENEIIEISKYISNSTSDIKILDARAAVYMIPIDRYNKNYDLLNKGNLGENGEQKIIEEIKTSENTQYLIIKDEKMLNWQTPLNIISFVKKSKNKVSEIGRFDIYE